MLVTWKPSSGSSPQRREEGLEIFSRWQPPAGLEIKAMYARADNGGGFAIVEVDSAETAYTATAPWAGAYNDYEMVPVVDMAKGVELANAAIAFRKG